LQVEDEEETMSAGNLPAVASREEWLAARAKLLEREKQFTRDRDALGAERRRLPMVRVEKDYRFTWAGGEVGLLDLFGDRQQLLMQHLMFDPAWDEPCGSCTAMADGMGEGIRDQLRRRNTAYVAVSRAPYPKLAGWRESRGWTFDWYSSYGGDFNYDYHTTIDPAVAPVEYNYRDQAQLEAMNIAWRDWCGEQPGISCFLRDGDDVFHTYSTYGRGVEVMMPAYPLLDITSLGRQEEWEQPAGRAPVAYPADPVLRYPV
jgi:predicted dithiol-disulfide oxidoreductase (DUF899 family)